MVETPGKIFFWLVHAYRIAMNMSSPSQPRVFAVHMFVIMSRLSGLYHMCLVSVRVSFLHTSSVMCTPVYVAISIIQ